MNKANDKGWHYSIDGEQIQLHNYKPGNQYMWHRDGIVGHNSEYKTLLIHYITLPEKYQLLYYLMIPLHLQVASFK